MNKRRAWIIVLVGLGLVLPACQGITKPSRASQEEGVPAICTCGRHHAPAVPANDSRFRDVEWIVKRYPK